MKFPTSKLSPPDPAFAKSRDCEEFTDVAAGVNAKASHAYDYPMARSHAAEVHWYEAAGIGRKEFKLKQLL